MSLTRENCEMWEVGSSLVSDGKKSRKGYSVEYKLNLISEMEKYGAPHVSREYNVDKSMLSRWKAQKSKFLETKAKQDRAIPCDQNITHVKINRRVDGGAPHSSKAG